MTTKPSLFIQTKTNFELDDDHLNLNEDSRVSTIQQTTFTSSGRPANCTSDLRDRTDYSTRVVDLSVSMRAQRTFKCWFSAIGDGVSSWRATQAGRKQVGMGQFKDGQRLNTSSILLGIQGIETEYPQSEMKVLKQIVMFDKGHPPTSEQIIETVKQEMQQQLDFDNLPKIIAVPVRISNGDHIALLALDIQTGESVWYDSRLSDPTRAKIMGSELTVAGLLNEIKIDLQKSNNPNTFWTNQIKNQNDYYNCGVHVLGAIEDLAKSSDLFGMLDRASQSKDMEALRKRFYLYANPSEKFGDIDEDFGFVHMSVSEGSTSDEIQKDNVTDDEPKTIVVDDFIDEDFGFVYMPVSEGSTSNEIQKDNVTDDEPETIVVDDFIDEDFGFVHKIMLLMMSLKRLLLMIS